jgi:hypothetical protein
MPPYPPSTPYLARYRLTSSSVPGLSALGRLGPLAMPGRPGRQRAAPVLHGPAGYCLLP